MPFRFVHTADLHLDSPLRSLALRDAALRDSVDTATRTALARIVTLCLHQRVDALLIAGDLYDSGQTSMKTARFLADQLGRLAEGGVRCFIIRGNHDAESRITRELVLPDGVTVFGARAGVEIIERADGPPVAVHGVSFRDPTAPTSLLPLYRPPVAGTLNVGLMHTSLDGAPGHDVYAPCATAALMAHGFAYWALGHIHARSVAQGAATVVMPGMPQGRAVDEAGAKTVTLATLADDGAVSLQARSVAVAQFQRVAVDLTGAGDMRAVADRIGAALAQARAGVDDQRLIARLMLRGPTPMAWSLRRDPDLLLAQAQERAGRLPDVSVEAVETALEPPAATGPATEGFEALRTLVAARLAAGAHDAEARALAEGLRDALPPECRASLGADQAGFETALAALMREGAQDALAHLREARD